MKPKYITNVQGNIAAVVQGDGAQVVTQDGKVVIPQQSFNRLIKCKNPACGELVPDSNFCNQCGQPLK